MSRERRRPYRLFYDGEFSSLDSKRGRLLSPAIAVTDIKWGYVPARVREVLIPPTGFIVRQREDDFDYHMSDEARRMHGDLIEKTKTDEALDVEEVDRQICELIDKTLGPNVVLTLTGYVIGKDREYIERFLPGLWSRINQKEADDVKTIITFLKNIHGDAFRPEPPHGQHDAVEDVKDCMRSYYECISFQQRLVAAVMSAPQPMYNHLPAYRFSQPMAYYPHPHHMRREQPIRSLQAVGVLDDP